MKHIKTVASNCMKKDGNIGCGECQSSCQSACKTSCTVGNQSCKNREEKVQVKKVADSSGNFRNQLHMQYTMGDMVILNQIEHLRLVDVAAVSPRIEYSVNVVKERWPRVVGLVGHTGCIV